MLILFLMLKACVNIFLDNTSSLSLIEDVRYQLNTSSLQERRTVEFRRISLTGFRRCTSRSHYRSISKQTTR
ncbi:hypothetical protein Tco_0755858, partial [Tanacetum coccineum]